MKPLQDMNLTDNFLMNVLTTSEEYGQEAMQYILGCILGREIGELKVIPQRILPATDEISHGVRLDVYLDENGGEIIDVEPDQNHRKEDIAALPRRTRFYHAKIDAASLSKGSTYDKPRNVIVIFITTYDPFGLDRVVYTMETHCNEEPSLPYYDGRKTIYLYVNGKKGNPSKELLQLLHYMVDSRSENAETEKLQRLDEIVTSLKQDGKVGYTYMKSWEQEARLREECIVEGEAKGLIKMAQEFGLSETEILTRLQNELSLSEEQVREYMERYGK